MATETIENTPTPEVGKRSAGATWRTRKRDGRLVAFDLGKIAAAIAKAGAAAGEFEAETARMLANRVLAMLGAQPAGDVFDVERIQDAVEEALGYLVKLDTNGSHPETLAALFGEGLLDYVAMDVKAPWAKYAQLAGVPAPVDAMRDSMRRIAASGVAHEFRTTVVEPMLSADDLREIAAAIPPGSRWKKQQFRAE